MFCLLSPCSFFYCTLSYSTPLCFPHFFNFFFKYVHTSQHVLITPITSYLYILYMMLYEYSANYIMKTNLKLLFILPLLLGLGCLAQADPDPLQDYCIADTTKTGPHSIFMNGQPCLDPELASPNHFATSALSKPGNTSANKYGFSVILTTNQNLPGHRTQGLSMARVDIAPDGLVPPHVHPRASEVTTCLKGDLLVGFVDTSKTLYTQRLRPGESFVFPKGLIHFLYNVDQRSPAMTVSGLSSENPGTQVVPVATFTSKPPMPDRVLEKAFLIDGQEVARIRKHLEG